MTVPEPARSVVLEVQSRRKAELLDVTAEVARRLAGSGIREGLCHVYVPHTTAGVMINENADPAVCHDILEVLDRLVPWEAGYHHAEGNAAAHIKSVLVGTSQAIPIRDGKLALGTWQGIFFCEFDGPRARQMVLTLMPTG
jgi:secondary thiamine-phosphate synthase enzyme